eukprot:1203005-Rhodomonas_salina.1
MLGRARRGHGASVCGRGPCLGGSRAWRVPERQAESEGRWYERWRGRRRRAETGRTRRLPRGGAWDTVRGAAVRAHCSLDVSVAVTSVAVAVAVS